MADISSPFEGCHKIGRKANVTSQLLVTLKHRSKCFSVLTHPSPLSTPRAVPDFPSALHHWFGS